MQNNTAKHFVLQLGSIITLYLSISFLLVLLFSIINLLYPDAIEGYWQIESSSSSVRTAIAMLVVFFPTYLVLTRKVNNIHRKETNHTYLGLTKWLIYLSLLLAGGVLLGDLVTVILAFLNGELTTRFLLKAGVLVIVVGGAFYYYLRETQGHWLKNERGSIIYAAIMGLVVIASVVTGFFFTEAPSSVREAKLDDQQVQSLREIQWYLEEQISINGSSTLPSTLEEAYGEFPVPAAPESREAYSYEITEKGFNLCATFSKNSDQSGDLGYRPITEPGMKIKNSENWNYKEGRYCFERIVN